MSRRMRRTVRLLGRRAGRGLVAALLNGGWALLAAMPVAAALFTWWDGLG